MKQVNAEIESPKIAVVSGIPYLQNLWNNVLGQGTVKPDPLPELDNALLNLLGIGLLPAFEYLHNQKPSFAQFEQWVAAYHNGTIPAALIRQCNALVAGEEKLAIFAADNEEPVLTAADLQHWHQHGYVIVRQAIPLQDSIAAQDAIWHCLGMSRQEPASWYKPHEQLQGIMLNLYRHPAIDKNRQSPRIRRAFEQLWGHRNLIMNTDKVGFNPPETDTFLFRGTDLHWDVSLHCPVPFGTQGILYLTDTAANQGALTVISGFHNLLEDWLGRLPTGTNPRNADLSAFEKVHIAADAGDCIIWHHALPHAASPNRASTPRLVQYLNWFDPQQMPSSHWL